MTSLLLLASLVTLRVPQSVYLSPGNVTITVSVKAERDNKELILELIPEEGDYERSSSLDMTPFCNDAGCKYPPTKMQITYPAVPAGDYWIRVTLTKHNGKDVVAGMDEKRISVR